MQKTDATGTAACGPRAGRPCRRGFAARLRADTGGSVTIEYAFVGPILILVLVGILQVALIYLAQEGLQTTAETAARLVMTGSAQTTTASGGTTTGLTAAQFKSAVCASSSMPPFLNCNNLSVSVEVVPAGCASPTFPVYTYSNGVLSNPGAGYGYITCAGAANNGTAASGYTTMKGTQGQMVIVQLAYLWPTIAYVVPTLVGQMHLGFDTSNNNRLLVATYVGTIETYLCSDGTTTSC